MKGFIAVIGVTGASSHSKALTLNTMQARDCVIGKKATFWGKRNWDCCQRINALQISHYLCKRRRE